MVDGALASALTPHQFCGREVAGAAVVAEPTGARLAQMVLTRLYTADPSARAALLVRLDQRGSLDVLCRSVGWQQVKDLHDSLGYGFADIKTKLQAYFVGGKDLYGPSVGVEWNYHEDSAASLIGRAGVLGGAVNTILNVGSFGFYSSYSKADDERSAGLTSRDEERAAKSNAAARAIAVAALSTVTGGLAAACLGSTERSAETRWRGNRSTRCSERCQLRRLLEQSRFESTMAQSDREP